MKAITAVCIFNMALTAVNAALDPSKYAIVLPWWMYAFFAVGLTTNFLWFIFKCKVVPK